MKIMGIISFIIAGICFCCGLGEKYVTQQAGWLICWLGFGIAGFGFFILAKFNELIELKEGVAVREDVFDSPDNTKLDTDASPAEHTTGKGKMSLYQCKKLYEEGLISAKEYEKAKKKFSEDKSADDFEP